MALFAHRSVPVTWSINIKHHTQENTRWFRNILQRWRKRLSLKTIIFLLFHLGNKKPDLTRDSVTLAARKCLLRLHFSIFVSITWHYLSSFLLSVKSHKEDWIDKNLCNYVFSWFRNKNQSRVMFLWKWWSHDHQNSRQRDHLSSFNYRQSRIWTTTKNLF